ncbi:hypothetical protein J8L70_08920 [Pseudoalteromonas sp. MMG010]|uniref:hypothetical protein n=1 Tax=Pseudoalteromonas sp. MMG010 TaxID=2822685 RepID=UPI001B3A558C|nr:hypothetical protein [Pseudoalteromonas sp. MMG010]MBQ4833357.1 hypothetical protein [Pseudoalteromonas sp. MMG010]
MVTNKSTKLSACCVFLALVAGCSSDARFHEIQAARLAECKFKADKEYAECVEQQNDNFEEFKKQQVQQP